MKLCQKCGNLLSDVETNCQRCGSAVEIAYVNNNQATQQQFVQ